MDVKSFFIKKFGRPPDRVKHRCFIWEQTDQIIRVDTSSFDGKITVRWLCPEFGPYAHREDGPARIKYNQKGRVCEYSFYSEGKKKSLDEMLVLYPDSRKELLLWM